jgi:large subunit ribosomal protein L22
MSKPKAPRPVADTEAQCVLSNLRVSPRKLNLVAGLIRNKPAAKAVADLTFSKRRIAHAVRKALESAIAISSMSTNWSSPAARLAVPW